MRRADFDAVGGFDERLKWCYDDCDLCLKMMSIGKKVMYSSRAIVIHQESVSQKKLGTNYEDSAAYFKDKWRGNIKIDINQYMRVPNYGACKPVLSFVSCVKNPEVYARCLGSLFKNQTNKNYEVIPILNLNNKYSAAKALNLGLSRAQADVVVFCHSDIVFLDGWIDRMMAGIANVVKTDPKWGVIGSAGIDENECTYGVVYSLSGGVGWGQTKGISVGKVQTVDELCFAVRKNSGLRLDEGLGGFHFYAVELCLQARSKGLSNYVLLNPLIHASKAGESSLNGGKADFMKWLNYVANKWGGRFKKIRTTTSIIQNKVARTFLTFKE
jgi:glycosyltransferase involved in cell wall biosynthesis